MHQHFELYIITYRGTLFNCSHMYFVHFKIYYSFFFFGVTKKTNLSTVEINIWPSLKSNILIFLCTFSLFEVFIYSSTHRDQYPRFAFQSVPKRTFDGSPLYVPSRNFEGFDIKGVGLVTKFCLTTVIKFRSRCYIPACLQILKLSQPNREWPHLNPKWPK